MCNYVTKPKGKEIKLNKNKNKKPHVGESA